MGVVYLAHDTKLDRDVAIKTLQEKTANDPGRLARFEREIKLIASLNHPNILTVHDVGREQDTLFVVTELLQGEDLRKRLTGGPLPWPDAVRIGIDLVDGLAIAHDRAIVHRDLKPANVFQTREGLVKILDFGLARRDAESSTSIAEAQTVSYVTHTNPFIQRRRPWRGRCTPITGRRCGPRPQPDGRRTTAAQRLAATAQPS